MSAFESSGSSSLPPLLHSRIQSFISGHLVDDEGIVKALKRAKAENDYVVCPHTAVAVAAFYDRMDGVGGATSSSSTSSSSSSSATASSSSTSIVVATASPAKFPEALEIAGLDKVLHPRIEKVLKMETKFVDLEKDQDWTQILKDKVEDLSARRI